MILQRITICCLCVCMFLRSISVALRLGNDNSVYRKAIEKGQIIKRCYLLRRSHWPTSQRMRKNANHSPWQPFTSTGNQNNHQKMLLLWIGARVKFACNCFIMKLLIFIAFDLFSTHNIECLSLVMRSCAGSEMSHACAVYSHVVDVIVTGAATFV